MHATCMLYINHINELTYNQGIAYPLYRGIPIMPCKDCNPVFAIDYLRRLVDWASAPASAYANAPAKPIVVDGIKSLAHEHPQTSIEKAGRRYGGRGVKAHPLPTLKKN